LAVDSEFDLVHKFVPAIVNCTTISSDAATQALQQNTWMHLACHGKQRRTQSYNSHFIMRDKHLTLLDIMERDIPHAEFAFLSACHTAVGDGETLDEVIYLAAGLQFSGLRPSLVRCGRSTILLQNPSSKLSICSSGGWFSFISVCSTLYYYCLVHIHKLLIFDRLSSCCKNDFYIFLRSSL
jgi:hypothetical protein